VDGQPEDGGLVKDAAYWRRLVAIVVVGGATAFLLLTLHPELILRDNTPTGGDMGAHVWGPAYLRDNLLSNFKLMGWSMDWYSGLPVYRFYMVVPALLILFFDIFLPYGIAMKIVAVIGILALPGCVWLFGRFARFAFPIPELLAIGATIFLYDESFTIYGGNIASTMAGEFSFSIALSLTFVAFAFVARALETGSGWVWSSVLLALAALSHGIVLLFVFGGVLLMVLLIAEAGRRMLGARIILFGVLLSAFWVVPFVFNHAYMTDMKYEPRPSGVNDSFWDMFFPLHPFLDVLFMVGAVIGFSSLLRRGHRVGTWMGVMAIVLAVSVFIARESLPIIGLLWNPRILPFFYLMRYLLFMVGVYEVAAFFVRATLLQRAARVPLPADTSVSASTEREATVDGEIGNAVPTVPVATTAVESSLRFNVGVVALSALVAVLAIGFRFQELPFGRITVDSQGVSYYAWGPFKTKSSNDGFVDGWARWNFTGYEGKSAYGEYYGIVQTMKGLGADPNHGCGRALWENNSELNKYGTTMSLMLLPFWTDGCIGSMEGLFFEAAGTTPYHFISAAAMSKQSSNPVRELRYDNNDAERGVRYLRELGVRYYMGFTPEAIAEASAQSGLTEVARSGPWVVYEVDGSDIVLPLDRQPVVARVGGNDPRERWLEIGTSWFQSPGDWSAHVVDDGPIDWQRVSVRVDESRREGMPGEPGRRVDIVVPSDTIASVELPEVSVTDVKVDQESVRFSVDRTGVPILVRVSYFPNWRVDGASGPFRVAPNMMVVVPTDNDVRLHYDMSGRDYAAYATTVLAIGAIIVLRRRTARMAR
jgi:hypothetical protein